MDKVKAYDEALERARKQRDDYQKELDKTDKNSQLADILRAGISAVEMIFPQLKDSDDERIRQAIIKSIKEDSSVYEQEVSKEQMLAYLEKQKQKSAEWSEEDKKRVKQLIYDTEHIRAEYEKRKKELGESFNDELIKDCDEQIAWLKDISLNHKKFIEAVDKLWSNEWNEEDEKDLAHIIRILDDCYAFGRHDLSKTDHENLVSKLKSLHPSWKPSEHQMTILKAVKDYVGKGSGYWGEGLGSLIDDLEKLM